MSEISEAEIKSMTKEQNYVRGYGDGKSDVLDKIRAEIESNMESVIGKYDSSIPKSNMPSYKIERNKVRKNVFLLSTSTRQKVRSKDGSNSR